jgi:putative component of membrane protein insertase Oxa1/YidC/SpoIIIJ protein YidD
MQPEDCNYTQDDPTDGLRIQCQPEESPIRSVDLSAIRICRLKHPVPVSRAGIDFVPPTQAHQSPPSNVFQIVEIDGEQDYRDDEDEDVVCAKVEAEEVGKEAGCWEGGLWWLVRLLYCVGQGGSSLHRRKPRKQRRVMGCELSRQLREPCWGASMVMGCVVDEQGGLRHAARD